MNGNSTLLTLAQNPCSLRILAPPRRSNSRCWAVMQVDDKARIGDHPPSIPFVVLNILCSPGSNEAKILRLSSQGRGTDSRFNLTSEWTSEEGGHVVDILSDGDRDGVESSNADIDSRSETECCMSKTLGNMLKGHSNGQSSAKRISNLSIESNQPGWDGRHLLTLLASELSEHSKRMQCETSAPTTNQISNPRNLSMWRPFDFQSRRLPHRSRSRTHDVR